MARLDSALPGDHSWWDVSTHGERLLSLDPLGALFFATSAPNDSYHFSFTFKS